MTGRVCGVSTHRRAPLTGRWMLCATPAGTITTPAQLTEAGWRPIAAPDTVAGALRAVGAWSLDGPPQRFDADDWWFRAVFDAPSANDVASRSLAFGGLAGKCRVWLNGEPLLVSDTMHVAHECAAPPLVAGENELLLYFPSLDARLAQRRPRPRWRAPMIEHQQLRWARVGLLGRTPGWSPPAPAIGPWRLIEWVDRDRLDIADLRLRTTVEDGIGQVRVNVAILPLGGGDIEAATLRVRRNGTAYESVAVRSGDDYAVALAIPEVTLWWPHTHGEPALYDAELIVRCADSDTPVVVALGQLGFRTLTVDTTDGDFAVSVNGVLIFCRGANWTPLDVVSPAAPAAATRAALDQVQAAGLNMLRVNGCTVYEDDAFFAACDALGLLVWQDLMFANMDYPADDAGFVATVELEARQHLARWQAHPSLAVICGNSEAEQQAAMWGAPRECWTQPLFDAHLATLVRDICPDVFYWPSSAHGGTFPHQADVGTTSYYGVGAYLRPLDDARRSGLRFASECLAFANVPSAAALARMPGGTSLKVHHPGWKARAPRDLGAGWDFDDVRDHYLQRLYGVDPVALRGSDHERYLQLSRAISAEVIEAAMSEWRRPASGCRGALVWFLRDLWAGAGWGLLDERGVPKAAFHGLRRAAAPVRLLLTDEGTNGLAVHVVNDPGVPLAGSVEVALYRDDGLRLQSSRRDVALPAHGGDSWAIGAWFERFVDVSRAYRFGPAEHALVAATLRDADGDILDRAFFLPEGLPATRRRDVGLSLQGGKIDSGGGVTVTVAAQNFAQSVHCDGDGLWAEDDYFHLAPGESRSVRLVASAGDHRPGTRVRVSALNAWTGAMLEIAA